MLVLLSDTLLSTMVVQWTDSSKRRARQRLLDFLAIVNLVNQIMIGIAYHTVVIVVDHVIVIITLVRHPVCFQSSSNSHGINNHAK